MNEERIGDLTALHAVPSGAARGYPLVLLHGLWAGAWIFEDWLEPAAERGWDVWAPNLRGRAGSRPVAARGGSGSMTWPPIWATCSSAAAAWWSATRWVAS